MGLGAGKKRYVHMDVCALRGVQVQHLGSVASYPFLHCKFSAGGASSRLSESRDEIYCKCSRVRTGGW